MLEPTTSLPQLPLRPAGPEATRLRPGASALLTAALSTERKPVRRHEEACPSARGGALHAEASALLPGVPRAGQAGERLLDKTSARTTGCWGRWSSAGRGGPSVLGNQRGAGRGRLQPWVTEGESRPGARPRGPPGSRLAPRGSWTGSAPVRGPQRCRPCPRRGEPPRPDRI